jgi:hypothetical protein
MPVTLKTQKPAEPVAMAQTPEFKALQDKIAEAKTVLDEVMTAIAALESKAPQPAAPNTLTSSDGSPIMSSSGQPWQGGVQESIKYNEDTTLARIVQLTGK